jgi:hypothetical protein
MPTYGTNILILDDEYRGEGLKKMKAYKCILAFDTLNKLREEFWGNY